MSKRSSITISAGYLLFYEFSLLLKSKYARSKRIPHPVNIESCKNVKTQYSKEILSINQFFLPILTLIIFQRVTKMTYSAQYYINFRIHVHCGFTPILRSSLTLTYSQQGAGNLASVYLL